VVQNSHTLILGWSDKTLFLIEQLCIAMQSVGGGVFVVLCDGNETLSQGT
jgi:hypothetical protein